MECFQERGRKASRRSQTSPGRNVGHACYLQVALPNVDQLERLPNYRVLDILDPRGLFQAGILKQKAVYEPPMDIYIDILVDCRGDKEPAMFAVIRWQVGAAAAQ